jgi:RNase P/RNase MRP subunit p29
MNQIIGESLKIIKEYPNYMIGQQGTVINMTTLKLLKQKNNKVVLYKNNIKKQIAIKNLVKVTWNPDSIEL